MRIDASLTIQTLQTVTTPSTSSAQSSDTSDVSSSAGVSVDLSKPGQLMGQLADLAQSDPTKFKAVTADIAQKLRDAASSQGGQEGAFLNKLADRFDAASKSGSASDLSPQGAQGHHHHHHHGGYGQSGSASSTGGSTGSGQSQGVDDLRQTIQGIISGALSATPAAAS